MLYLCIPQIWCICMCYLPEHRVIIKCFFLCQQKFQRRCVSFWNKRELKNITLSQWRHTGCLNSFSHEHYQLGCVYCINAPHILPFSFLFPSCCSISSPRRPRLTVLNMCFTRPCLEYKYITIGLLNHWFLKQVMQPRGAWKKLYNAACKQTRTPLEKTFAHFWHNYSTCSTKHVLSWLSATGHWNRVGWFLAWPMQFSAFLGHCNGTAERRIHMSLCADTVRVHSVHSHIRKYANTLIVMC